TERVNVGSSGAESDDYSSLGAISDDGSVVAFFSYATNLVANDTNGKGDVFVHERTTGITERVSVDSAGVEGTSHSVYPWISSDGRFVAFESVASNLVAGDTNHRLDVFVRDRVAGTTDRVSVDSSGAQGNGASTGASLSADGLVVTFSSFSS